jgi:hypothetical protein
MPSPEVQKVMDYCMSQFRNCPRCGGNMMALQMTPSATLDHECCSTMGMYLPKGTEEKIAINIDMGRLCENCKRKFRIEMIEEEKIKTPEEREWEHTCEAIEELKSKGYKIEKE